MKLLTLTLVTAALVMGGCAGAGQEQDVDFRPREATRVLILTPAPTAPFIPAVSANATVAPAPSPDPSAHAPTPPSAEGVATAQVEIGEITRVPILENTPAPGEVGTVTAPGEREGEEVAVETPTGPATPRAAGTPANTAVATGAVTPAAGSVTPEAAQGGEQGAAPGATGAVAQPQNDASGLQVFRTSCAGCHGVAGEGVGQQFPRLEGNEFVLGDPQLVIQVVLNGRGLMPAWRDQLSDAQIAAVVSYIRSAWGNNAPPVTADMVARQRQ